MSADALPYCPPSTAPDPLETEVAQARKLVLRALDAKIAIQDDATALGAIRLALKLAGNILEHPDEGKYTRIKNSSAAFQRCLAKCPGGLELVMAMGFRTAVHEFEEFWAVEVSPLSPLKYACRRLILVGDPNQLPATVFSDHAMKHNYEQSLFQRLQIGGQRVAMLTTQYRMHPQISRFPGRRFYDGALKDAPKMAELNASPWHAKRCFRPYVFYDVDDGIATEVNMSWCNELEAQLAMHIVKSLLDTYAEHIQPMSIGVISPYNAQVRAIRRLFTESLGASIASQIEVNSVDGFQGREKEVIILSAVRSDRGRRGSEQRGIGFLKDARRMNVSITRARTSVFVLGHVATLKEEPLWEAMIHDASERQCLLRAHSPIKIWFGTAVKELAREAEEQTSDGLGDGEAASVGAAASAAVVQKCGSPTGIAVGSRRTAKRARGKAAK